MRDEEKIEILDKALEMIEANPKHWDQKMWHCGTSHCLAGFCDLVIEALHYLVCRFALRLIASKGLSLKSIVVRFFSHFWLNSNGLRLISRD